MSTKETPSGASVVITVYNRPHMIEKCLDALVLQKDAVREVIVSDDGSEPGAVETMKALIEKCPLNARLVLQEDRGYRLAAARNNGIREADGDYVVSIDCDILLLPGSLTVHLENARRGTFLAGNRAFLDRENTEQLLGDVTTPDVLMEKWNEADKSHIAHVHHQFIRNVWFRRFGLAKRHKPKMLGCHFSLFKDDILKINGFDEHFEGWGLEDDDFATRLHMAGVRGKSVIVDAPALHMWHHAVESCPPALHASPNYAYFKRREIQAYCSRGLK